MKHILPLLLAIALGCTEQSARDGYILLRNDLRGEKYGDFLLDGVYGPSGQLGVRKLIKTGTSFEIPHRSVRRLRLTRPMGTHRRIYQVICPDNPNSGVVLKLIDVHLNKMNGGCKLVENREE